MPNKRINLSRFARRLSVRTLARSKELSTIPMAPPHWSSMRISHTSDYGVIVELDGGAGYRLVSSDGTVGPVLSSPAPVAKHMPYVNWVEPTSSVDLDLWLAERGLTQHTLSPDTRAEEASSSNRNRVFSVLEQAKRLAGEYYELTGCPLGCTGEVAEYEAARLLGLELAPVRQSGYDATRTTSSGIQRLQIKGRCIHNSAIKGRMGRIDTTNLEWDAVLLVLLDNHLEALAIYESGREEVMAALQKPGSKSRNERGALGISQFISIAHVAWKRPTACLTSASTRRLAASARFAR